MTAHVVLDNDATHNTAAVERWVLGHPGYRLHFAPTPASWLNQVKRFFAEITEERFRRRVFKRVPAPERVTEAYLAGHDAAPEPFAWTADAYALLDGIKSGREWTSDSGH